MVLKGESWQGVNPLRPPEFWNDQFNRGLAKCFTIKVEKLAVYTKILLFRLINLLFKRIIRDISRFFGTETSGINRGIWLKEGPK